MVVNYTITLNESQYDWFVEIVEYEIHFFEKLGSDRTEDDTEQMERLQALRVQLETTANQ